MTAPVMLVRATAALIAVAVTVVPHGSARAQDAPPALECAAPGDLVRLANPLRRVAQRLATSQPLTIVAIGSSSTEGAGASSPAHSYPSRLAVELQALLPRARINVINRGVGGEEARHMIARFDRDVLAEKPDLVLWQVGSNSVLKGSPLDRAGATLQEGLQRLRGSGADVILINPQYAPKVIAKADCERMVQLIDAAAKQSDVDLFRRFSVMRHWRVTRDIPFSAFLSPDELHMNDWSYGCVARLLAQAIHEAATRPTVTAGSGR